MSYLYRTQVGTFSIEPDDTGNEAWKLCIGGIWLASFGTPEEAASALPRRDTGWRDWDTLDSHRVPADLTEWEELK